MNAVSSVEHQIELIREKLELIRARVRQARQRLTPHSPEDDAAIIADIRAHLRDANEYLAALKAMPDNRAVPANALDDAWESLKLSIRQLAEPRRA